MFKSLNLFSYFVDFFFSKIINFFFPHFSRSLLYLKNCLSVIPNEKINQVLPPDVSFLLANEELTTQKSESNNDYSTLFSHSENEETTNNNSDYDFVPFLREKLTSVSLPGISKRDQILLLALVETIGQIQDQRQGN